MRRRGGRTISEFETFIWVILAGVTVGLFFDFYRSFRRWQDWGQVLTFSGDLFFSLIAMAILFYFFEKANALDFRVYIIWGSLLGLGLYLRLLSRFTLGLLFKFYRFISLLINLIHRGIQIPIKGLIIVMRPLYAILQWLSLLLYRIGEVIFHKRAILIKKKLREWWKGLLPPRTNG